MTSDTSVQIPVINVQLPDMSNVVSTNNEVPATRYEEILTVDLWESVNVDWTQDLWMDDASANESPKADVETEVRKRNPPCRTCDHIEFTSVTILCTCSITKLN